MNGCECLTSLSRRQVPNLNLDQIIYSQCVLSSLVIHHCCPTSKCLMDIGTSKLTYNFVEKGKSKQTFGGQASRKCLCMILIQCIRRSGPKFKRPDANIEEVVTHMSYSYHQDFIIRIIQFLWCTFFNIIVMRVTQLMFFLLIKFCLPI